MRLVAISAFCAHLAPITRCHHRDADLISAANLIAVDEQLDTLWRKLSVEDQRGLLEDALMAAADAKLELPPPVVIEAPIVGAARRILAPNELATRGDSGIVAELIGEFAALRRWLGSCRREDALELLVLLTLATEVQRKHNARTGQPQYGVMPITAIH